MMKRFILAGFTAILRALLLLSLMLSMACGLKRSNPLDPRGNSEITEPDPVKNITIMASAAGQLPHTVTINWDDNNPLNTRGYYIYRSLGYFAAYALVDSVRVSEFVHSSANDNSVQPGEYYYRVSAYMGYPGGNLEGRRSEPIWVYIP